MIVSRRRRFFIVLQKIVHLCLLSNVRIARLRSNELQLLTNWKEIEKDNLKEKKNNAIRTDALVHGIGHGGFKTWFNLTY